MKKYLISIDQGTTGTTAILVETSTFKFVDKVNLEFPQIFPKPSWVEHNLHDIWGTVEKTIDEVLRKNNVNGSEVECIGITNQRETTCAFSKNGTPLFNAIVWQDRRTEPYCQELKPKEEELKQKTGLTVDPYFSASKMNWMLNNVDKVKEAAQKDDLCFGTIDTFLLYKLTNCESFKTETTNASRTLLMDLKTSNWDNALLDTFGVSKNFLPEIIDSFAKFGETKGLSFLPDGIPITGILGDQQAALFGQGGIDKGSIKCTYGTGSFVLLNTGESVEYSKSGLLSTSAYQYQGKPYYALEGSCYITGAAVQWLRDNLKVINTSPEVEALANKVGSLEEMKNVLFLPFFTGIGSPHWKSSAKAAIVGLTRDTNDAHLAKACLDGIALSIEDLLAAFQNDSGIKLKSLNVDGGAVNDNLLMQTQADVSDLEIVIPEVIETTGYGAALAAAIGAGFLKLEEIPSFWKKKRSFSPLSDHIHFYQEKKTQWQDMIKRLYF